MDNQDNQEKPKATFTTRAAGFIMSLKIGRLFWGGFLLLVGTLALLNNFDLMEVRFGNLWRLWPLVIVAMGLSVLSLKGLMARLLAILFVLLALAGIFIMSVADAQSGENRVTTASVSVLDDINSYVVSFSGGAGLIDISSQSQDNLVEASLDSNFAELEYVTSQEGTLQLIDLEAKGSERWWLGDWRSDFKLTLSESMPLNLRLDVGASDISADLSNLQVERLDVNAGASSMDITLGDLADRLDFNLNVGASSIDIRVPESVGVRVSLSSSLSETRLPNLVEVSDGVYESSNYAEAAQKLNISGSSGVSSLKLTYY